MDYFYKGLRDDGKWEDFDSSIKLDPNNKEDVESTGYEEIKSR